MEHLLDTIKRVHFIGIGGSGMSPLAEILHMRGYTVTGSDDNPSDNVDRLRASSIDVHMGLDTDMLGDAELVVYTAAVRADHPALERARQRGIPLMERAKLLGALTRRHDNTVAVAGTHGKTTTTSMIAQILLQADLDPSVFIGGRLPLIGANGRAGSSDTFVCEACEFQDHYLAMTPAVALILNVDADHLDYFGTLENVIASFRSFAALATKAVIVNADDPNTMAAVAGVDTPLIRCGAGGEWYVQNVTMTRGSYGDFDLYHDGALYAHITLGVPGAHNVQNAVMAAAAAHLCGATAAQITAGLAEFHGAGRRFEFLGTFGGVTVADDYAHHPTELRATISAAKALGYERVWAVFQPFTFSRTARHLEEFAEALSLADEAIVSDILGSREQNTYGVSSEQITARMSGAHYLPTFEEITAYVTTHARPGDLVLTMGGGNIYMCARMMARKLEEKDV